MFSCKVSSFGSDNVIPSLNVSSSRVIRVFRTGVGILRSLNSFSSDAGNTGKSARTCGRYGWRRCCYSYGRFARSVLFIILLGGFLGRRE